MSRQSKDHIVFEGGAELISLIRNKIIWIGPKIPQQKLKITIE
jgi:hypothetical protein